MTTLVICGEYALTYNRQFKEYQAGCRVFTKAQALDHWGVDRASRTVCGQNGDELCLSCEEQVQRAKVFRAAIRKHSASLSKPKAKKAAKKKATKKKSRAKK